jgi:hypothetical protein
VRETWSKEEAVQQSGTHKSICRERSVHKAWCKEETMQQGRMHKSSHPRRSMRKTWGSGKNMQQRRMHKHCCKRRSMQKTCSKGETMQQGWLSTDPQVQDQACPEDNSCVLILCFSLCAHETSGVSYSISLLPIYKELQLCCCSRPVNYILHIKLIVGQKYLWHITRLSESTHMR